ncbi:concanavalin A-like lectin/glucanase domain-containing protein [Mycena floridula]|nr:concanavalin A-like lectin/glucanase domain-containing protein [Mycena floridula]
MYFCFFAIILLAVCVSALQCDCGFQDPLDLTKALWTSYFESNFTTMTWKQMTNKYHIMQNNVTKNGIARDFEINNVAIDGSGIHLIVHPISADGTRVPSGGIYTKNTEFGFGSYHWSAQTSGIPGSVQAFYVYKTDSNEIDMEYISKPADQNQTLKYSVKPQQYNDDGQPLDTTLQAYTPSFNTSEGLHTYSFVWNASAVTFGLDDVWVDALTVNVPQMPGVLSMNHWSDSNPKYSGPAPTTDSVVNINRVWVFYNATSATLPCKNSQTACNYGENAPEPDDTSSSSSPSSSSSSSPSPSSSRASRLATSFMSLAIPFITLYLLGIL